MARYLTGDEYRNNYLVYTTDEPTWTTWTTFTTTDTTDASGNWQYIPTTNPNHPWTTTIPFVQQPAHYQPVEPIAPATGFEHFLMLLMSGREDQIPKELRAGLARYLESLAAKLIDHQGGDVEF